VKKINLRFCGGCNPRINRQNLAQELAQNLATLGYEIGNFPDSPDFTIHLSGCTASCALENRKYQDHYLSISGTSVNGLETEANQLISEILNRVRGYLERLAN